MNPPSLEGHMPNSNVIAPHKSTLVRPRVEPILLSMNETARSLGLSRSTLYRLLNRGAGPRSFRLGGRRYYPLTEMTDWVARLLAEGTA